MVTGIIASFRTTYENFKEIFCGSTTPSKNGFRAKVRNETSPYMPEANKEQFMMARRVVFGDVGYVLDQREGIFSDNDGSNTKHMELGETSREMRITVDEGDRAEIHTRRSSWGRKSGSWEMSPRIPALSSRMAGESTQTGGTRKRNSILPACC